MNKFCNKHGKKLAKPKKRPLIQTFLKRKDLLIPEEDRRIIKENNKKKIVNKYNKCLDKIELIVDDLLNVFKLFVCNNETFNMDSHEVQISEAVYFHLIHFFGIITPFS